MHLSVLQAHVRCYGPPVPTWQLDHLAQFYRLPAEGPALLEQLVTQQLELLQLANALDLDLQAACVARIQALVPPHRPPGDLEDGV